MLVSLPPASPGGWPAAARRSFEVALASVQESLQAWIALGWTYKRSARQQGIAELRQLWQEAIHDKAPGVSAAEVLDRLERKYQAIAEAAGTK